MGNGANFAGSIDEVALYNLLLDDPNGDGDRGDNRITNHFEAAGSSVPEPMTPILLGVTASAMLLRRRHTQRAD